MYLEKPILFAQSYTLFPPIVSFVQICSNPSKLYELVLFQFLSKNYVIKVVKSVDWCPHTLKNRGEENSEYYLHDQYGLDGTV